MPIAKIQLEDGRIAKFEVPDGTTEAEVLQFVQDNRAQFDAPAIDRPVDQAAPQEVAPQQDADLPQAEPQNITQFRPREDIIKELSFFQATMGRSNKDENLAKILELSDELKTRDNFVKSTRAARELPELGSQVGVSSIIPDADATTQALVSAALVSASDPQELAQILKSASPDIGISQDEAGNLIVANNKLGMQAIINRPGISGLDVGQFVGRAAAFTPSGLTSTPAKMVLGGMATEAALQGAEYAAGGDFNPEAVVTEGAASVVGLGLGRALRGATPADVKKGIVRESLLKRLEAGDAGKDLLGKKAFNGKIFSAGRSAPVNVAKRQGFDERALRVIEVSNPETKSRVRSMVDILEGRKNNARVAATRRSSDPIGGSVFKRYKGLDELRKEAGAELDSVAKTKLKNISVNTSNEAATFYDGLKDIGIKFRMKNGKAIPVFSQMDDINEAGAKRVLSKILPRLKEDMTAQQAHKLKRLIDSSVTYNGLPTQDVALPKALESSLKKLRASLNEKIGESSSEYAAANAKFSQAVEPLSQMDKMFKSMLGLSESQSIETGIGTKASRTLMSNNATRGAMLDVLEQADSVLKSNGREFKDDLINQVVVIDELERMFGSEATASFTGASARAVEQKGIEAAGTAIGIPLDLLRTSIDAVKGVNEEAAIKALKKIIK